MVKIIRNKKSAVKNIRVSGLLIPSEWNEAGEVVGLCIKTFNEDEYHLPYGTPGLSFMRLIGREVDVCGSVRTVARKKYLTVYELGDTTDRG